MRKREIEIAAESGLPLSFRDVAKVKRRRGVRTINVELRHAWPERGDARVFDGVRRAIRKGARALLIGRDASSSVTIWSRSGVWVMEVIDGDDL